MGAGRIMTSDQERRIRKMIVDKTLKDNEWIVFNAGNHYELVKMRYKDYEDIIHPHKHDYVPIIV